MDYLWLLELLTEQKISINIIGGIPKCGNVNVDMLSIFNLYFKSIDKLSNTIDYRNSRSPLFWSVSQHYELALKKCKQTGFCASCNLRIRLSIRNLRWSCVLACGDQTMCKGRTCVCPVLVTSSLFFSHKGIFHLNIVLKLLFFFSVTIKNLFLLSSLHLQ